MDLQRVFPSFYGMSLVPESLWKGYGYILLNIAGSDGDVSDPELEWLTVQCAESVGVSQEIIASWEEYDFDQEELEDLFMELNTSSFANVNKLLIYDAIRMSSADGDYAEDERDQVYQAAKILKIPQEAVTAIEALVELEQAASKLRMTIL